MPPHDEDGNLVDCSGMMMFYRNKDGNMLPFTGIQEAELIDENIELIKQWLPAFEQTSFTISLKGKNVKRMYRKMFRTDFNRLSRSIRSYKRKKEKARRNRLKYGPDHVGY